jgi:mono/diheme cytochrome c family protein
MKGSRRTSTEMLMRFVRACCAAGLALAAQAAPAYENWIETHVASTYPYVLGRGESAGRTVLLAAGEPGEAEAAKGRAAFEAKCVLCHSMGGGDKVGPDLRGVTRRHPDEWLTRWLLETDKMQKSDPAAKALLAKYKTPMPNLGLKAAEVRDILKFLHWNDQRNGLAKN